MKAIEADNEDLKGVLPKTYNRLENSTLVELLKLMSSIPADIEGDVLGRVFEYFLGNFAFAEGSKGIRSRTWIVRRHSVGAGEQLGVGHCWSNSWASKLGARSMVRTSMWSPFLRM